MSFKTLRKKISNYLYRNSPQILSGIACAGVVSTAILASRATIKSKTLLEENKIDFWKEDQETKIEVVKTVAKTYLPTIVSGIITVGCIVGSQRINSKRVAVLAGLYSMSKEALQTYQMKVIETVGEKTEKQIQNAIDQDKILKDPPIEGKNIYIGPGKVLCYDPQSGRYFYHDYESIRKIINELNHRLISEMYIDQNDFYFELGLPGVKQGEDMGWHIDKGLMDIKYDTMLTEDGRPCIVLNYNVEPKTEYV